MLPRLLAPAMLAVALIPGSALAVDQSATSNASNTQSMNQSLPQQLKQKLENQGFSDVQVAAGSYVVKAKDKDGDPVMAIIGPHSMTVFSQISSEERSTTGSASDADQSGSNTDTSTK